MNKVKSSIMNYRQVNVSLVTAVSAFILSLLCSLPDKSFECLISTMILHPDDILNRFIEVRCNVSPPASNIHILVSRTSP